LISDPDIRVVADITRVQGRKRPEKVAIVFEDRETTYRELDRRASQVANGIINAGLKPESRIAVLDKNSDSFFEVLFGAAKANCVLVAVNWRLAPTEISYIINDATAEILFVGEEFFPAVEKIRDELKTVNKIIAFNGSHDEWEAFGQWRDRQSEDDPDLKIEGADVALQMYTSGTTGHPKGAQLTNDNLLSLLPTGLREWGAWDYEDVNLVCMPVFHISGSGYALVGFFAGIKTVLLREVNCDQILKLIPEHKVTKAFFVPALLLFLLQTPGIERADLLSLDLIFYGASPIPLDLLRNAMQTFGCGFGQVYGLTETTGAITYLPPEFHDPNGNPRMLSCGKPHGMVEIRIVDVEGNPLPAGEVGEIICRSGQNMKGYWNLPDATQNALRGEWFYTGDAGYLDEEGYLYIHDRVKDMIVSGGENIYPAEVESVLFGHPSVADVAVIGVPDDRWGEAVKAIVVKKPGQEITAEEIIAYARDHIAHYKAPKSVDFIEALPRNPSGKILKRELRKPYWEGRTRQVN
jgi:long-chain acyl-CoA synthetase